MNALRRLVLRRSGIAACMFAAALLMKVLVPAGFMPAGSSSGFVIQICSGYGAQTMTIPMSGKGERQDGHQGKEMPCAFSGLSAPSLAAADPVLLAAAIAFIMLFVVRAVTPPATAAPAYLRPPLRGPPSAS